MVGLRRRGGGGGGGGVDSLVGFPRLQSCLFACGVSSVVSMPRPCPVSACACAHSTRPFRCGLLGAPQPCYWHVPRIQRHARVAEVDTNARPERERPRREKRVQGPRPQRPRAFRVLPVILLAPFWEPLNRRPPIADAPAAIDSRRVRAGCTPGRHDTTGRLPVGRRGRPHSLRGPGRRHQMGDLGCHRGGRGGPPPTAPPALARP